MKTVVLSMVLMIVAAVVLMSPILAFADLDETADNVTTGLKHAASGKFGKMIFGACLLVGIVTLVSGRYRMVGVAALVMGIGLAIYGNLLDSVWTLFGGQ